MSGMTGLPVELIEHVIRFTWTDTRAWIGRRRDHLSFSLVCRTWNEVMGRIGLQYLHADIYPMETLNLRLEAHQDDAIDSRPGGHACRFAAFRIGYGRNEVEGFLSRTSEVFARAPFVYHALFDFMPQSESTLIDQGRPEAFIDITLRALAHAPVTLTTLDVICGCPSVPGDHVEATSRQLRTSFPNIQRLSFDCDDHVFVLDMVARCPNITSLRLTCAYDAVARVQALTPHLHTLALYVGPHPLVLLSSHAALNWRRSPLENWRLTAAICDRVLFNQSSTTSTKLLELEYTHPWSISETEMQALALACKDAGVRIECIPLTSAEAPCFHSQFFFLVDKQRRRWWKA